jgi:hypothetical protein
MYDFIAINNGVVHHTCYYVGDHICCHVGHDFFREA